MRDLVIMPAMAQRRESLNMGEFAEDAIIVEETSAPKRVNHFIEANTQEVTLQHLQQDCIIPSFASMEETISHQSFIGVVVDAAKDYFHGEQFDIPEIRISHPINGRIPSALGKKASELTDEEKTTLAAAGADMSKYLDSGNEARILAAYTNRDPRLQMTIITPYSQYLGSINSTDYTYTLRWPYRQGRI